MTTKNHALVEALVNAIIAYVNDKAIASEVTCNIDTAVLIPDAVRCWWPARECTHFTLNPQTGLVSFIVFSSLPIKEWNSETKGQMSNAGKPGNAVIDEETRLSEFWKYNSKTMQNKVIYRHLLQDYYYDNFVRDSDFMDVSGRYQDKFILVKTGETISGADMRGKGDSRWGSGLLAELDDMFYIRLAKRFYAVTGVKADQKWVDSLKEKIVEDYPEDLAISTIKYLSLSAKVSKIISEENFDEECWPWPIEVADKHLNRMISKLYAYSVAED